MARISAYLNFNGDCREGMAFYKACLGGDLVLQAVEETPAASQMPPEMQKSILHATLTSGNVTLLGSDMAGDDATAKGGRIVLVLECSSEEEIKTSFARLSEGGQVLSPLKLEFWGGIFGQIADKYGVNWMLNYEKKA